MDQHEQQPPIAAPDAELPDPDGAPRANAPINDGGDLHDAPPGDLPPDPGANNPPRHPPADLPPNQDAPGYVQRQREQNTYLQNLANGKRLLTRMVTTFDDLVHGLAHFSQQALVQVRGDIVCAADALGVDVQAFAMRYPEDLEHPNYLDGQRRYTAAMEQYRELYEGLLADFVEQASHYSTSTRRTRTSRRSSAASDAISQVSTADTAQLHAHLAANTDRELRALRRTQRA